MLRVSGDPEMDLGQGISGSELSARQRVFAGGGEMGALMRSFDWSKTPLGPVENWSPALRATTRLLLANCFPMLLWWGPDFHQIYNDAYSPVLGDKHPRAALGRPFRECWSEVFDVLGPLAQTPYEGGPPTWMEDIPLEVNRFGFVEETHFTIGYSPVPDETVESGIGGVLATVHEITGKVVAERRVAVLRDLATRTFEATRAEDACAVAAATLGNYRKDIPFALIYLLEEDGRRAQLAGECGARPCTALCPEVVDLGGPEGAWPLSSVLRTDEIVLVEDLKGKFGDLPPGPWSDPADCAAVVPVKSNIEHQLAGFLVAGISPRLRFDDAYRGFLELAAAQISIAIANARGYEAERKRSEALAEIDRAKTAFFTNISHEFRTPLTLMMAPLEDALAKAEDLPREKRDGLELAHRNGLRLGKLVNTLLDFSRIEAGRAQAVYEPVNLSALTADLASVFRSAMERAGLRFVVDCPQLGEPVYVDREMWEKIVLNLLSNAFKFTLKGSVEVRLSRAGGAAKLAVSDTGVGIAAGEQPHVFERFYRMKNAGGRSYEGSGIGLALVQELAKLNGGEVTVESEAGRGSTFTVSIPFGTSHFPAERIGGARAAHSTAVDVQAYIEEAFRWISDSGGDSAAAANGAANGKDEVKKGARIVLAEDNRDMREYVRSLLAVSYQVETVAEGEAALEAVLRETPDLVLADVMMPRLDGFGLLKALRADERTASIPVVLLSARAGEEARVEGISAGADDYLVKPFSARELVARVDNVLTLARLRRETALRVRESEDRYRALVAATSDVVYQMSPDWGEMRQLRGQDFIADTHEPNRSWIDKYIHPDDHLRVLAAIEQAIRTKSTFELEHRVLRMDGTMGWVFSRAIPLLDANGEIVEWFGTASDITARKQAQQALLRGEKLASLGRMAATIAHEINNPLEAVTNLLFLARTAKGLPESARQHLETADAELKRVAHIARQSLGFYRESNAPALTSINGLLGSAIELLKNRITGKHAAVRMEGSAIIEVMAVAGELRQVFSNLLANSLDAIDKYGTIRIRVSRYAGRVRITIGDNGKGIRAESRDHMFEPFFTTKGTVGTGLGLWVTKQIIDKHRGTIQVKSRNRGADTGTVFSITLPLEAVAEKMAAD